MQARQLVPIAIAVVVLATAAFWFFGTSTPLAPPTLGGDGAGDNASANAAIEAPDGAESGGISPDRRVVDAGHRTPDGQVVDAAFRAALTRLEGRTVDDEKTPLANVSVRLFRFDMVQWLPSMQNLTGKDPMPEPEFEVGEVLTGEDGKFAFDGVLPRGMYMLDLEQQDGAGSERFLLVERVPSPGETEDLGDIVMPACGVLTGTVVDKEGKPLADALVRCADAPGAALSFIPLERIDPEAGFIVDREIDTLVEAPAWAVRRFEDLPIPRTRTAADGSFRLTGVVPGDNLVAVTAGEHLSLVLPGTRVDAGEEKDLGKLRMREGEWAEGKVLDDADEPVANIEVRVAPVNSMAPVHFAMKPVRTDENGRFQVRGGLPASGDVIAAVRRDERSPWVLSERVGVLDEIVVRLASRHSVDVLVVDTAGEPVAEPDFKLLIGEQEQAIGMTLFGASKPVDLEERLAFDEERKVWTISDLASGPYTLVTSSSKCAAHVAPFDLPQTKELTVTLPARTEFEVFVGDQNGNPVAFATVFARGRGGSGSPVQEVPMNVGRTDRDGLLRVTDLSAEEVRLTASHPAFGSAHAKSPLPPPGPVQILFPLPGAIEGVLTDQGGTPQLGEWTVVVIFDESWETRQNGAGMPPIPQFVQPDAEGRFRASGLVPGEYDLAVLKTLDVIRSPGTAMMFATSMWRQGEPNNVSVEVQPGGTAQVSLDTSADENYDGPQVQVTGSVMIDGRIPSDVVIEAQMWQPHRFRKVVDLERSGRFDLGLVPVGGLNISIREAGTAAMFGPNSELYDHYYQLQEGQDQDIVIDISFGSLRVECVGVDGMPLDDQRIQLAGDRVRRRETTRSGGVALFENIEEGEYTIETNADGQAGRTKVQVLAGIESTAVLQLQRTFEIRGRIDWGNVQRPDNAWVQIQRVDGDGGSQAWEGIREDGTFGVDGITEPGEYRFQVSGRFDGDWKTLENAAGTVMIGGDMPNLVLQPIERQPEQQPRAIRAQSGG
jgi:protocatechuate 3,4-dioxygenase beta subunit